MIRSPFALTDDDIAKCRNLRVVVRAGAGTDNVDRAALQARGIAFHAFAANANAVAELVIGGLLFLKRNLSRHCVELTQGRWCKHETLGTEIAGSHFAVVGFGRVGRRVAALALAFGASCVAVETRNRWQERSLLAMESGVEITDDLDAVLPTADVLVLSCPLRPDTENLMNVTRIGLLARDAYLVNVARGRVWDFDAVLDALWCNRLAGVVCDVYPHEPPAPDPRFAHERLVLTPHIGGQTFQAQKGTSSQIRGMLAKAFDLPAKEHF